jgi:hypothetical protein
MSALSAIAARLLPVEKWEPLFSVEYPAPKLGRTNVLWREFVSNATPEETSGADNVAPVDKLYVNLLDGCDSFGPREWREMVEMILFETASALDRYAALMGEILPLRDVTTLRKLYAEYSLRADAAMIALHELGVTFDRASSHWNNDTQDSDAQGDADREAGICHN